MKLSDRGSGDYQDQVDALELAKKVFEVVDIFRITLILVFVLVLWAFVYLVLLVSGALNWSDIRTIMYGFLMAFFVVMAIMLPSVFEGLRALRGWGKKYLSYAFLTVFEFAPRTKANVSEEVVEKLRRIYPSIDKKLKKDPEAVDYETTIEGKKGRKFKFDVIITLPSELVVVEIDQSGSKVTEQEVMKFMENLSQVSRDTDLEILQGIIVSDSGFTEEAVDYVSLRTNWIKTAGPGKLSPTLLKVTESGYQIEWLQAMQQSQPV